MKNKIIAILLLITITFILPACSTEEIKTTKLTYYALEEDVESKAWFYKLIQRYNKYCTKYLDESYQIEVVPFESESEMNLKMSTEIMAGGGPDIMNTKQMLPFEKLVENGSLLDINSIIENDESDNQLDFNNYNSIVMNSGVFDGKRYIIPLYYKVNYLVSSESKLRNFNFSIKNGTAFTYKKVDEFYESFFTVQDNISFFDNQFGVYWIDVYDLFYSFINSYIDFESKQVYFDTEEFRNALPYMKQLTIKVKEETNNNKLNDYLFYDFYSTTSPQILSGAYARESEEGESLVITRGFLRDEDEYSANIQMGIAINNNTDYADKALEFIKFALSENTQGYFIGINSKNNNMNLQLPVNNKVFKSLKEKSDEYTDDFGYVIGYGASDNEFIQCCFDMIENITECEIYENLNGTYFGTSVISEIVMDYLNDSISEEKFIRQLTSATYMYMLE
ncbi:MAG: ABC transporter substrate-binding protein [Ruminococcus sp.]|nr:ABC transporter substrate-binding protein [Ruminococcus sp.]